VINKGAHTLTNAINQAGKQAEITGDVTSTEGKLINKGIITGDVHAKLDINNESGVVTVTENGISTDIPYVSIINGNVTSDNGSIVNTGIINVTGIGVGRVYASQDLINKGTITVNKSDNATVTIQAKRSLQLGDSVTKGVINKVGGTGNLEMIAGSSNSGGLSFGHTDSVISDSTTTGNLHLTVNNGGLNVTGTQLSKAQGSGKLNVDVVGSLDSGANITGYAKVTNGDLTNSGSIDSGATLYVSDNAPANIDSYTLDNKGTIKGGAILSASDNAPSNTYTLTNTGTIAGGATSLGAIENSSNTSHITGNATAGTSLTNAGTISGNALANGGNLTNTGMINITGNGVGQVYASQDLINKGTVTINKSDNATVTIQAKRALQLGDSVTKGVINKTGGTGNLEMIAGSSNSGGLSFGHTNSAVTDSTASGNLHLTVNNGGLNVTGTQLSKAQGSGKLNVDVVGSLDSGADITGYAKVTNGDLTNSGSIDGSATLNVTDNAPTNITSYTLNNTGTITGGASLNVNDNAPPSTYTLKNTGTINGNVTSAGAIENSKLIDGQATANTYLKNIGASSEIRDNAIAKNRFLNNAGTVGGYAEAGLDNKQESYDLTNSGWIKGHAYASGSLFNAGTGIKEIGGDAEARNGSLTNNGIIHGYAEAKSNNIQKGNLTNSGTIGLDNSTHYATATGKLINYGTINGFATAGGSNHVSDLTNSGIIKGHAYASGNLFNTGIGAKEIEGDAEARNGSLTNDGVIHGHAEANSNLSNNGASSKIGGYAKAINGWLTTEGTITGYAKAGSYLKNLGNSSQIGGDAEAQVGYLSNDGTIGGTAKAAGGDLTNNGSIGKGASVGGNHLLKNNGTIIGDAASDGTIENNLQITGNASANGGDLANTGSIGGHAYANINLANSGTSSKIGSYAKAMNGSLTNQGSISGDAQAGGYLESTGDNSIIGGDATALGGHLTNEGHIAKNASAKTSLKNLGSQSVIGANATAQGGDLTNAGRIGGFASVHDGNLTNTGSIGNGATLNISDASTAGHYTLANNGSIAGATLSGGAIENSNLIDGNATAGTYLKNIGGSSQINGNAVAQGSYLTNQGSISGNAQAGGYLESTGDNSIIGGDATAWGGHLTNEGHIAKNASAKTSLKNLGSQSVIGANATAHGGDLNNAGRIGGFASVHDGDLTNSGSIGSDTSNHYAISSNNIINSGSIKGRITAGNNLINSGTIAISATNLENEVDVAGNLNNSGIITIDGSSDGAINVGQDMEISGSDALVAFSNSGRADVTVQGAMTIDNGGKLGFSNDGQATLNVNENLIVGLNGTGIIERTGSNIDDFIVDPVAPGSTLTVQNDGSKIVDSRPTGNMNIFAEDSILILNRGMISRESSIDKTSELNLYTRHLVMQKSAIDSSGLFNMAPNPDVTIEQIQKNQVVPLDLKFISSGSLLQSKGNFGVDGHVFYLLPANGPYGNAVTSIQGKLFIAPDNLQEIQRNGRNVGGPFIDNGLPQNGNYYGNGFRSNQATSLQSVNLGVISKPADLPEVPPDPCGLGSTLEIKHSDGVIPAWGDLVSFSVFPDEQGSQDVNGSQSLNDSRGNPSTNQSCDQ